MFSYRICQNQELVDKFLDPNYLPSEEEKQLAEDCFQQGILPCYDVDGQSCDYNPDCSPGQACYRNDWFTCGSFHQSKSCKSVDGHAFTGGHGMKRENETDPFCQATGERRDCGYVGIGEEECHSRACCWDPVEDADIPWCYHINGDGGGLPGKLFISFLFLFYLFIIFSNFFYFIYHSYM